MHSSLQFPGQHGYLFLKYAILTQKCQTNAKISNVDFKANSKNKCICHRSTAIE